MAESKKIAVVTGANRGIGFEVCRQLAEKGLKVVLTARDATKGKKAAGELQKVDLDVVFHQLNVADEGSIQVLAKYLKKEFGRVDVLVNNAGVYLDGRKSIFKVDSNLVKRTMETNFLGPLFVSQAIFPLMKRDGRIINVSSHSGQISGRLSLTSTAQAPLYGISKASLNVLTIKLAGNLKGVKVNSVAPGRVRTDMGGRLAPRSVKKGAETIVWLATAAKVPSGKFLEDKKEIPW